MALRRHQPVSYTHLDVYKRQAKYRDKDPRNNTILTQNVRMSLNGKMHRRNLLDVYKRQPIQPERSAFDWRYLLILPAGAGVAGLVVLGRNWLKKRKNEKKWEEYTK